KDREIALTSVAFQFYCVSRNLNRLLGYRLYEYGVPALTSLTFWDGTQARVPYVPAVKREVDHLASALAVYKREGFKLRNVINSRSYLGNDVAVGLYAW